MKKASISELQIPRTVVGTNSIERIKDLVLDYNVKKVTVITDEGVWGTGLIERPIAILESAGVIAEVFHNIPSEPAVEEIEKIFGMIKDFNSQMFIGIGGGSVMDTAKILSIMVTNSGGVKDFLGIDKVRNKGIPTLMIPTTAGTGAEVTPNAIVLLPEKGCKQGIVSKKIIPDCVVLDPLMTTGLPPALTASTGMDAFCHAIECYISIKANPVSDSFAIRAIKLIWKSIRKVYSNGSDMDARLDMLLGSFFAGLALSTSGGTAIHAMSYPIGGRYRVPHGVANAILLPHLMKFNLDTIELKLAALTADMKLSDNAISDKARAEMFVEDIYSLVCYLNIPENFKHYKIPESDIDVLAQAAFAIKRLMDNNPRKMDIEDIKNIYKRLL